MSGSILRFILDFPSFLFLSPYRKEERRLRDNQRLGKHTPWNCLVCGKRSVYYICHYWTEFDIEVSFEKDLYCPNCNCRYVGDWWS